MQHFFFWGPKVPFSYFKSREKQSVVVNEHVHKILVH